jgi:hypothetical protein
LKVGSESGSSSTSERRVGTTRTLSATRVEASEVRIIHVTFPRKLRETLLDESPEISIIRRASCRAKCQLPGARCPVKMPGGYNGYPRGIDRASSPATRSFIGNQKLGQRETMAATKDGEAVLMHWADALARLRGITEDNDSETKAYFASCPRWTNRIEWVECIAAASGSDAELDRLLVKLFAISSRIADGIGLYSRSKRRCHELKVALGARYPQRSSGCQRLH